MSKVVAPDDKWLSQMGGISALILGIGYLIIIPLYVSAGEQPTSAEGWLGYLSEHTSVWWAIVGLSVFTDLLFLPIALSLYFALKDVNRNAMLLATIFVGLFVFLDLALTWTNYAALISLSNNYVDALNNAERSLAVTAAIYPYTVLQSNLTFIYNTLTLSLGILITGYVMLQANFDKTTAYLGLATGVLGMIAVAGSFLVSTVMVTILASTLTTIWLLFLGYHLSRG